MPPRIIAIDWSGARLRAQKKIWLAEARDGEFLRLESDRHRTAVADHLIAAAAQDPNLIIGLDFAFSLPAWYLDVLDCPTGPALWETAADHAETWLQSCRAPFWGRPGRPRPELSDHYRATEAALPTTAGIRPKSVFQIGGAGAVGTGSLRGLPILHRLHQEGFAIWPFDPPGFPRVVEIYPRLLTGPVVKSNPVARAAYLAEMFPSLPEDIATRAASSEDAFDAAVSALIMARHHIELAALPPVADSQLTREGIIWYPSWDTHLPSRHEATDARVPERARP